MNVFGVFCVLLFSLLYSLPSFTTAKGWRKNEGEGLKTKVYMLQFTLCWKKQNIHGMWGCCCFLILWEILKNQLFSGPVLLLKDPVRAWLRQAGLSILLLFKFRLDKAILCLAFFF